MQYKTLSSIARPTDCLYTYSTLPKDKVKCAHQHLWGPQWGWKTHVHDYKIVEDTKK